MYQIGEKIRKIRRIKNLGQKELGEMVGLSQGEISKIESEGVEVSLTLFSLFAKKFDMPVEDILHYGEKVAYNITTHEQNGGANGLVLGNPTDVEFLKTLIEKQNHEIERLLSRLETIEKKF